MDVEEFKKELNLKGDSNPLEGYEADIAEIIGSNQSVTTMVDRMMEVLGLSEFQVGVVIGTMLEPEDKHEVQGGN